MSKNPREVIKTIANAIRDTEWENQVFVAGGFVRDMILLHPSKDIDLVVTMDHGGVRFAEWITEKLNCRTPTNPVLFPRFGTARFVLPGYSEFPIECVMPRSETYTPGSRNPEVSFASLEEDAKRRDFTVNSLYWDFMKGDIVDFTDGRRDIERGIIRTAMDPNIIFADDPLRMLRAIRFAVRFGWTVDPELLYAMKENYPDILTISQERVTDELSKMLVSDNPAIALKLLRLTGVLSQVLPEIASLANVTQNDFHVDDVFHHTLKVVQNTPPNLVARLTALYHDAGKTATREIDSDGNIHFYRHDEVGARLAQAVLERMKFPTSVIDSVVKGVANHMRLKQAGANGEAISDKALRKLRVDLGDDLDMILDVMHADNWAHHPDHVMPNQIPGIRQRMATLGDAAPAKVKLPIDGHDVMRELHLTPGPKVKTALEAVTEEWFANPDLTREEALTLVRQMAL